MDVKDFDKDNLSLTVTKDNELIIEGNQSTATANSSSLRKFKKSFHFPGIQGDKISAVVSADGIFTVNVPVQVNIFVDF